MNVFSMVVLLSQPMTKTNQKKKIFSLKFIPFFPIYIFFLMKKNVYEDEYNNANQMSYIYLLFD